MTQTPTNPPAAAVTATVSDMAKGMKIIGYFLVKNMAIKTSSNDRVYADYLLADQTGEINAKLWDVVDAETCPGVGTFLKVQGLVTEWQDKLQLRMDRFREVSDEDPVDVKDFVPSAPEETEDLLAEIELAMESIVHPGIAAIVRQAMEECGDALGYYPAALKNHHAIRSGLVYHTVSMLRLAEGILAVYDWLNADLVTAGVILHDMAKIQELEAANTGIATRYTREGMLLGHIPLGMTLVDRIGRELGVEEEVITLLEHMILAHHYEPEYGSPRRPMFAEAEVLHYLDILDARMYDMNKVISELEPGNFSENIFTLHNRKLYRRTF